MTVEMAKEDFIMDKVNVGMWKLPGLRFKRGQLPEALQADMKKWSKDNHCGYWMTEELGSFKSEAQRDWWILRWIDDIPKIEADDA